MHQQHQRHVFNIQLKILMNIGMLSVNVLHVQALQVVVFVCHHYNVLKGMIRDLQMDYLVHHGHLVILLVQVSILYHINTMIFCLI